MERIIAIKNLMIEIMRSIHYILNYRKDEIDMNVITGYKSETAIELDNLWNKYYALSDELQAACFYDSTIYSGIVNSINKEAELMPIDRVTREAQRRSIQRGVEASKELRGEGGIVYAEAAKAEIEAELIATTNIINKKDVEIKAAYKGVLLTVEDLEEVETSKKLRREKVKLETIIKEVDFYIEMSKKPAMQEHIKEINIELLKRKKALEEQQVIIEQLTKGIEPKQETVEIAKAEEVVTVLEKDDNNITNNNNKEETATQEGRKEDAEFWDLVDKTTTDKKMDLVSEVWGDLSSLYNEVATPDEIVLKEDEYIDINELTYESQEVWKQIKGMLYEVSTKGNVRIASTKKEVKNIMTTNNMRAIYLDEKWFNLGGLVYSMFNKEGSAKVTYIDNNIENNHILNLKAA